MDNIVAEKSCDFAVVGGGGGGLVAAVRAAQAGQKVIVLEKSGSFGGGMRFAGATRTFCSKWQAERGRPDVTADYGRRMLDDCYWRVDTKLVSNILRGTGAFFDWFIDFAGIPGDAFRVGRYVFDDERGPLGPQYREGMKGFGGLVMETLEKKAPELGVELLKKHRAVDAETDENGRLTAILAETEEGLVRIRCRACLLSPGSWINVPELTEALVPGFFEDRDHPSPHKNPNYTGDGLRIAETLGAFIDRDSFCLRLMGPMYMVQNRTYSGMTISPYAIAVNLDGARFASEPLAQHMDSFDAGAVVARQPKGAIFALFTEEMIPETIALGPLGMEITDEHIRGEALPGTMAEALADLREAEEKGTPCCFRADTLEELAEKTGIDPEGLKKTIEEYNGWCAEGFDWGYFKPENALMPFAKGPYYAVQGFLATDGAFGGVKVDPNMQAYAEDGGLVEGLYVTGDFASGRHVAAFDGLVKRQFINDLSWTLAGGYLAGAAAAEYLSSLN